MTPRDVGKKRRSPRGRRPLVNAVELLTNDHRTVDKLFDRYLGSGDAKEKKGIVEEVIRELSIHASIEEQVLYPGIRGVLPDGDSLADEAINEHKEVKELLADLDRMDASDSEFDTKVRRVIQDVRHHADEEEREMFPKLRSAVPKKRLDEMGRAMERAKKAAPTRPHPHAPARPPGNLVAGPVAAVVDRVRDAVSGRASGSKRSGARKSTAKKSSAKSSSAKKATGRKSTARKSTAKKTTARKSTAKKTSARRSSAKKGTARKSTAKRTSARKSTSRKSGARKSTAKKSSAKKSSAKKTSSRKSTRRKTTTRKGTGRKSTGSRS
jgi:hemerythrin superfamily protein